METLGLSTIAQLLYAEKTTLDFARIVSELDAVLSRLRDGAVIAWDCDDLVTFDLSDTRIILAWTDVSCHGLGGCLTVSVGPCLQVQDSPINLTHDLLCSRLVERIQGRFQPAAVLWSQMNGAVDAELVDVMTEALPGMASCLPPVDSILDDLSRADLHLANAQGAVRRIKPPTKAAKPAQIAHLPAPEPAPQPALVPANDHPDLPRLCDAELARLRVALYPPGDPETVYAYSTQMRLAAHCMNATLILVWAPLGAAVMTYTVLKGENMRLSARMMAVTGTLFALAHSPVGQTMAAMAKSIG